MHVIEQYISKRIAAVQPFFPDGKCGTVCGCGVPVSIAVVIPVRDEYPELYKTLKSLCDSFNAFVNSGLLPENSVTVSENVFRIVCVVNNTSNSPDAVKDNNRKCVCMISGTDAEYPPCSVRVELIDCTVAGREIPEGQGVGFSRKIGMDYALVTGAAVIACLDADTLVSANYVEELYRFGLRSLKVRNGIAAAVTGFTHQRGIHPVQETAVRRYESFLKNHSRRLQSCGSIYYPVALGPTIVCTAAAYASCGGMNVRTAGEDFYFLQALIKVCAVLRSSESEPSVPMLSCTVFPSARVSERVPFGTGRKVAELSLYESGMAAVCGGTAETRQPSGCACMSAASEGVLSTDDCVPVEISGYPDYVYGQIALCIRTVAAACSKNLSAEELALQLGLSAPASYMFLEKESFFIVWEKLRRNNKTIWALENAFQCWFDGLKIIRLIHHLMR